ncbi:hypothetical protein ABZY43_08715, partial [Streptomyces syringium]|uniref:hypothetical protein n=1 Tax=Streptomyces syringium TaxID=76729 RepID=UPI0033BCFD07
MPHPENGLTALAGAATVALQPADDAALWGSGFFIAPGWVLTCAHVLAPHLRPGHGSVFHVRGSGPVVADDVVQRTGVQAHRDVVE